MQIDDKRIKQLEKLQEQIGATFKNIKILNTAFLHPSFVNEKKLQCDSNQRLEFLGDAVLELVISHFLFDNYPHFTEGQMTKTRALIVCEQSLSETAKKLSLGQFLLLGKGEETTGGRIKNSILADTYESLIGAIYLEKGYKDAKSFVIRTLENTIIKTVKGENEKDFKTILQEVLQKKSAKSIDYKTIKEKGPDHNKIFYVNVFWNDKLLGTGFGTTKKQAEQMAAKNALNYFITNKGI